MGRGEWPWEQREGKRFRKKGMVAKHHAFKQKGPDALRKSQKRQMENMTVGLETRERLSTIIGGTE